MTLLEAIILGLVQGATEFLPVSSSGHLILMGQIMGLNEVSVGFELVCHLGTLLAIILVMNKDIFELVKHPLSREMRLIAVATVPTVIIVFAFQGFFRNAFGGEFLIYSFLITAILLMVAGFAPKKVNRKMTYVDALVIGAAQGIAAVPGISRSGATIAAGSLMGNNRASSARFSFLISIPIIIGSSIVELATNGVGSGVGIWEMLLGFAASFASGLFSIKFMLKLLQKFNLDAFSVYLFVLAIFLLMNQYVLHLF